MDQAEAARLEERINREITMRFPAGSVRRATLVLDADGPTLAPDEFGIRVFVTTTGPAEQVFDVAYGQALRHVLTQHVPPPLPDEAREALAALES